MQWSLQSCCFLIYNIINYKQQNAIIASKKCTCISTLGCGYDYNNNTDSNVVQCQLCINNKMQDLNFFLFKTSGIFDQFCKYLEKQLKAFIAVHLTDVSDCS